VDQALRQLERQAYAGSVDALWQAYYMLKRSLPNLSIESLRKLQSACGDEIYCNRSFDLQLGSGARLSTINIENKSHPLREIVVDYLEKYDYFKLRWHQNKKPSGWGYIHATPETKLKLYMGKTYGSCYIEPLPELEVPGDDPPKPRYSYLVWACDED